MDLGGPFLPRAADAYLYDVAVLVPCYQDLSSVGQCQLLGAWPELSWLGLEHLMEPLHLSTPAFFQCCVAVFTEAEDSECCHGRAADPGTDPVKEAQSGMQRGTSTGGPRALCMWWDRGALL